MWERIPFVINLSEIPYFDGHCDTIWRCMYGERRSLREDNGHFDLLRGTAAMAAAPSSLPCSTTPPPCLSALFGRTCAHAPLVSGQRPMATMAVLCRTGGRVDDAVSTGRTAALLSIEGLTCWTVKRKNLYTAAGWGRPPPEPGLEQRQRPLRLVRPGCGPRPV